MSEILTTFWLHSRSRDFDEFDDSDDSDDFDDPPTDRFEIFKKESINQCQTKKIAKSSQKHLPLKYLKLQSLQGNFFSIISKIKNSQKLTKSGFCL